MSKVTFVIEKKDNFGEWQSMKMSNAHTKRDALILLDSIISRVEPGAYRVVEYRRMVKIS